MGYFRSVSVRAVTLGILLIGASLVLAPAPAAAATRTWAGGNGDVWSVAANWAPAVTPVDGDDLVFDATGSTSSTNDLAISINTITFDTPHEISGNVFTLTSGITSTGSGPLAIGSVTLGGSQTWSSTAGEITVLTLALNGHTWTADATQTVTVDTITGTGAIVKNGAGTLRISGDSFFSGPVTVAAGVMRIETPLGLGLGGSTPGNGTTVNAGATLTVAAAAPFTLDGEALTLSGTGAAGIGALTTDASDPVTFTGPITLAATARINGAGLNRTMTFNGSVNGPGDLVILDSTIVVFGNSANTVPGIGFAGAGSPTLRVGMPNALSAARINLPAGATFDINDSGTGVLGLDGAGSVTLGATTGLLTINNTLPSTFTGVISGIGGILIKDGPGMLTLGGANTFARGPRIDAGVLRVTHPNALGAGDGTQNTGTLVLEGATLALDNVAVANERIHLGGDAQPAILQVMGTNPSSIDGPVVMTQLAAVTGTDGATLAVNGELTTPTAFTITNATLLVMNPTSGVSGPVTVNAGGALAAGANGVFGFFTKVALNGGTFALNGRTMLVGALSGNGVVAFGTNGGLQVANETDATFAGTSTGTGTLLKSGFGALTLSGPFAVTGNVTINGGTLVVAHDQALAATPRVDVGTGGALAYAVAATVPYQISFEGAGPAENAGAVQVLGGNVTFSGPFGSGGFDGTVRVNAPHVLTWTSAITAPVLHVLGSGAAVFAASGHTFSLLRIGLTAITNTPAGPTTVRPGVAGALNGIDLFVAAGSTFDLNRFDHTVKYVLGGGTIAVGARTLTIQTSSMFDGIFTGTGTIDASGQSLNVTGASTFTGSVTANNFSNSGTLPASVHVTGDTLRLLPNSVTGALTMAPGVILIAGDTNTAAGVTTGNLNFPAGAQMSAYMHTTTMMVNGTVTLGGELTPFLHPSVSTPGQVLTLIDNDGTDPVVGMFGNFGEGGIVQVDEASYRISYSGGTGNDVTLTKQAAIYFLSEGATGTFFDTDLLIASTCRSRPPALPTIRPPPSAPSLLPIAPSSSSARCTGTSMVKSGPPARTRRRRVCREQPYSPSGRSCAPDVMSRHDVNAVVRLARGILAP